MKDGYCWMRHVLFVVLRDISNRTVLRFFRSLDPVAVPNYYPHNKLS